MSTIDIETEVIDIKKSPRNEGIVELIVARPGVGQRQEIDNGELDLEQGLIGDNWIKRVSDRTKGRSAYLDRQLTLMNSKAIQAIAKEKNRWKLSGDQFFVGLDLSPENLPPGTQLSMGTAIIVVTSPPHLGCKKFAEKFGQEALKFVNSELGISLNLRGINARVIFPGSVSRGSIIKKVIA